MIRLASVLITLALACSVSAVELPQGYWYALRKDGKNNLIRLQFDKDSVRLHAVRIDSSVHIKLDKRHPESFAIVATFTSSSDSVITLILTNKEYAKSRRKYYPMRIVRTNRMDTKHFIIPVADERYSTIDSALMTDSMVVRKLTLYSHSRLENILASKTICAINADEYIKVSKEVGAAMKTTIQAAKNKSTKISMFDFENKFIDTYIDHGFNPFCNPDEHPLSSRRFESDPRVREVLQKIRDELDQVR